MILTRRVALDGIQLDELDERIIIRSVDVSVPKETVDAVTHAGRSGQRMTLQHWDSLSVTVAFAIDIPKRALAERRAVWETVIAWAIKRGWLTVGHMPGRRMWADKVILPSAGDLWDWTADYSLSFIAYGVPFWQDEVPASATADLVAGEIALEVPGMAQTVLDVTFQNISGMPIKNIEVSAAGNTITLNNVNLQANQALTISHGTDGLLRITAGDESVYSLYTGSDDLYVDPGPVTVQVNATRAGRVTVSATGRYF